MELFFPAALFFDCNSGMVNVELDSPPRTLPNHPPNIFLIPGEMFVRVHDVPRIMECSPEWGLY